MFNIKQNTVLAIGPTHMIAFLYFISKKYLSPSVKQVHC